MYLYLTVLVTKITTGKTEFNTNGITELVSPNYPSFLHGGLREEYIIEASSYNGVVTIEVSIQDFLKIY